jgi:NADH-quinone oxidoreductase subunit H
MIKKITLLSSILIIIYTIILILVCVAIFTLVERKFMASIQRRKGPNVIGLWGLLQPFADGIKLILKELHFPKNSNKFIFLFSPIFLFIIGFGQWVFLSFIFNNYLANIYLTILFTYMIASLNVYGILFAGWSSNSKYAFLGGIRSAAQMVSYEVLMGFIFLQIGLLVGSFNLFDIIYKQKLIGVGFFFYNLPIFIIFFIVILAETNRAPFDLPEAEAELVAGYNIEYSGILFAFFFLAEYANMLFVANTLTLLFFGGGYLTIFDFFKFFFFLNDTHEIINLNFSYLKYSFNIVIIAILFVIIRAAFPRLRYDQLMLFAWQKLLPLTIAFLLFSFSFLWCFNGLPLQASNGFNLINIIY